MKSFVCFTGLTICHGKPYVLFKLLLVRMKIFRKSRRLGQSLLCDVKLFERCTVDGQMSDITIFTMVYPGVCVPKTLKMPINGRASFLKLRFYKHS